MLFKGRQHMLLEDLIHVSICDHITMHTDKVDVKGDTPHHISTSKICGFLITDWGTSLIAYSVDHGQPSCLSRRNLDLSLSITLPPCPSDMLIWSLQACLEVSQCKSCTMNRIAGTDLCTTEMPQDVVYTYPVRSRKCVCSIMCSLKGTLEMGRANVWESWVSWVGVIILGCPFLGISLVDPVAW